MSDENIAYYYVQIKLNSLIFISYLYLLFLLMRENKLLQMKKK